MARQRSQVAGSVVELSEHPTTFVLVTHSVPSQSILPYTRPNGSHQGSAFAQWLQLVYASFTPSTYSGHCVGGKVH
jgi:hypothetical protein